MYTSYNMADN